MANIEDVYKRLNELHAEILKVTVAGVLDQATEAKQDELIAMVSSAANQQDIISKLSNLDAKGYSLNPKIEENPQELLRLIHSGIDTMIQQQILTNNLLKLILS
jgi:hypothetical protein